ncbi:MAG: hypothetical protein QXG76_03710 [Candidatus Bathyarchaeia archaeon]
MAHTPSIDFSRTFPLFLCVRYAIKVFKRLADASWLVEFAEKARGAAHAFANLMASGITKIVGAIVGALDAIRHSSILAAIAEKGRAIAHAIAHAVSSLGVAVPIIIAATAAAVAGIMGSLGLIKFAEGGIITKPTMALIGEKGPEAVIPLWKIFNTYTSTAKTVNVLPGAIVIQAASTPQQTADEIIGRLRRSGVV